MRKEESIEIMNQLSREYDMEHQMRKDIIVENSEYNLFRLLKPKVSIDGNQHCVLYGSNLMEGVAGFGDTLFLAILDFNKQFHLKIVPKQA